MLTNNFLYDSREIGNGFKSYSPILNEETKIKNIH